MLGFNRSFQPVQQANRKFSSNQSIVVLNHVYRVLYFSFSNHLPLKAGLRYNYMCTVPYANNSIIFLVILANSLFSISISYNLNTIWITHKSLKLTHTSSRRTTPNNDWHFENIWLAEGRGWSSSSSHSYLSWFLCRGLGTYHGEWHIFFNPTFVKNSKSFIKFRV